MALFVLVALMFTSTYQISDPNCLRARPRVLDADFSFVNKFENHWDFDAKDVEKHAALFSTRFKDGHDFYELTNAQMKLIGDGLSLYTKATNKSFHLFLNTSPGKESDDLNIAVQHYRNDFNTIMKINSGSDGPMAGLYVGHQTNTYARELEAVEAVFGSKANSKLKIGTSFINCVNVFRSNLGVKFLKRMNFLTFQVYPVHLESPEESANDVISRCNKLRHRAQLLNITADIKCRVSYPTIGTSSEGVIGSVSSFQRFWCRIIEVVTQNNSQTKIIMDSAFDATPMNYKSSSGNLHDASFHNGWWRRRDTTSYESNAFVEKVEELEGGREHGNCTPLCSPCGSSSQCCDDTSCEPDNSFQPHKSQISIRVCLSHSTNCAPRLVTTSNPLNFNFTKFPKTTATLEDIPSSTSLPTFSQMPIPSDPEVFALQSVMVDITIIGVILLVVIAVLLVIYRGHKSSRILTAAEVHRFFHGSSALGGPHLDSVEANEVVNDFAYDNRLEVTKDSFEIYEDQMLCSGAFGVILKGRLRDEDVAVKMTRPGIDKTILKSRLLELKVLLYLGQHENIVSLVGADTSQLALGKLCLFLELCPIGCLLEFLRNQRNIIASPGALTNIPLNENCCIVTCKDLLQWSIQVSSAMVYLAEKRLIHGDIAARNVYVFSMERVKLTKFGQSDRLVKYTNFIELCTHEPWMWRHMSVEALRELKLSTQADVWSFGVTMWEMFTLGCVPYPGEALSQDFIELLLTGLHLECPQHTNPLIYEVMCSCWAIDVNCRPPISVIHLKLLSTLDEICAN